MEMRQVERIPEGEQWLYEPKWDGFRCLAFRDGADVALMSKSGQPLARYFPEIVEAVAALSLERIALDGELVIPNKDMNDFELLLQRIHPAQTRTARLARETPARYEVFDVLIDAEGDALASLTLAERRMALERIAKRYFRHDDIAPSPATRDYATAQSWYRGELVQFDGVVAKLLDRPYASGLRTAAVKIKRKRTADCVVGGFRYAKTSKEIASLLLGLYDAQGRLNHVGFTSALNAKLRKEAKMALEPLVEPPGFTGCAPGGPSRWRKTEEPWHPVRNEIVVEVQFDHITARRFRHGTRFLRFRDDKDPRDCTWGEVRPPRSQNDPTFESLLGVAS